MKNLFLLLSFFLIFSCGKKEENEITNNDLIKKEKPEVFYPEDLIALELNEMYRSWDLLKYRSFGYGHSFGVLSHYYGREAGLELREDCDTVLEPGMVVSMEPMITIPEGMAGAGGYREHDILVITDEGNRNITGFPYGPEHLIVKK